MARVPGTFEFSSNFEVLIEGTLDARQLVAEFQDLLDFTEANYIPNGFVVIVANTSTYNSNSKPRGMYQCIDNANLDDEASWVNITGSDLGYIPEDEANKATDFITINNTLYPTVEAVSNELDNYQLLSEKGQASGYTPLGADSKVPSQYLPALTLTDTYVVTSEAEMLALSATQGDVAIRTDLGESFILQNTPASTLGNWVQILDAADVQSVNALTGNVQLDLTYTGGVLNITGGTNPVDLEALFSSILHAATHIEGGSDEIAGELLAIDYTPVNYSLLGTDLGSHLAGIDEILADSISDIPTLQQVLDAGAFANQGAAQIDFDYVGSGALSFTINTGGNLSQMSYRGDTIQNYRASSLAPYTFGAVSINDTYGVILSASNSFVDSGTRVIFNPPTVEDSFVKIPAPATDNSDYTIPIIINGEVANSAGEVIIPVGVDQGLQSVLDVSSLASLSSGGSSTDIVFNPTGWNIETFSGGFSNNTQVSSAGIRFTSTENSSGDFTKLSLLGSNTTYLTEANGGSRTIIYGEPTGGFNTIFTFPDLQQAGSFFLPLSVNGEVADAQGEITVPIPTPPLQDLQSVLDEGAGASMYSSTFGVTTTYSLDGTFKITRTDDTNLYTTEISQSGLASSLRYTNNDTSLSASIFAGNLGAEISTYNNDAQSIIRVSNPVAYTTFLTPIITVDGDYTLATSVNGVFPDTQGNIELDLTGEQDLQSVVENGNTYFVNDNIGEFPTYNDSTFSLFKTGGFGCEIANTQENLSSYFYQEVSFFGSYLDDTDYPEVNFTNDKWVIPQGRTYSEIFSYVDLVSMYVASPYATSTVGASNRRGFFLSHYQTGKGVLSIEAGFNTNDDYDFTALFSAPSNMTEDIVVTLPLSVNGVFADEYGNIEVSSGSGGPETDPIFVASEAFDITATDKSNWTQAFNNHIVDIAVTGTTTKTITLTQQDGGTLTAQFTDIAETGGAGTADGNDYLYDANLVGGNLVLSVLNQANVSVDLDARYLTSFTETDPVFVASPSYSITNTDKNTWTNAYNANIVGGVVTGTTTKSLVLNLRSGGSLPPITWTDISGGGGTTVTDEHIEDVVGAMVSGNTESSQLNITYSDNGTGSGKLNFILDDDLSNYDNSVTNFTSLPAAPNNDALLLWDDSANSLAWITTIPNSFISSSSVTQHEEDLTIDVSQITNLVTEDPFAITGVSVTGSTNKTITITRRNGSTVTDTFTDLNGSGTGGSDGNDFVNNATFNSGNGILTLNISNQPNVAVDLDGRYSTLSIEQVQDNLGNSFIDTVAGSLVDIIYNDASNKLFFDVDTDLSKYDNSLSLFMGVGDNISLFNNDAGYISQTLTEEQVQDIVGGMVSSNTENGISVTYNDSSGKLNFDVTGIDLTNYVTRTGADQTITSRKIFQPSGGGKTTWYQFNPLLNLVSSSSGVCGIDVGSQVSGDYDIGWFRYYSSNHEWNLKANNQTLLTANSSLIRLYKDTFINTNLEVDNNLQVNNNTLMEGQLSVDGNASFGSNVTVSGEVSATDFVLTSDRNLKENIKPLEPRPIDIKFHTFNMIGNEEPRTGVIAQEVEEKYPEFVKEVDGTKKVKVMDMMMAKIAELEQRIKELENGSTR